jgi:hypothetical protein
MTTLEPEIYEPDEALPRDLVVLRRFARLMDEAVTIPGTNRKIGLDAAIGLIPGVGDIAGALLSTWVIFGAIRHRVPVRVILRMIGNIMVDLTVGAIPIVGDIFDFFWEENMKNLDLLFRHRHRQKGPRSAKELSILASLVVSMFIFGLFLLLIVTVWIVIAALRSR